MLDKSAMTAHSRNNLMHTFLLLGGIGGLFMISAGLLWGLLGVVTAAGTVIFLSLGAPQIPAAAVMRLYNGQLVDPMSGGQLVRIVAALAERAELGYRPNIYVIPSMALNAFATGTRGKAVIGITEGLLRRLSMRELAGVLAHEMSHIRNNDLTVMGLADLISRLTQVLSYIAAMLALVNVFSYIVAGEAAYNWFGIIILYLAPALSNLLQLGLSRVREFDADLDGASLTGDPAGLASALQKVERYTGHFWEDLMLPVPARRVPQPSVLRSHPTTEQRIARLEELVPTSMHPPIEVVEEPMISMVGLGPISMRPRYRFPGIWF
ncbi:MAG: zinc metalloprotease HtpX [Hyphomicrobiaceae bacterium]